MTNKRNSTNLIGLSRALLTFCCSLALRNKIELLQEQKLAELTSMVNLGSDCYVQAKVYAFFVRWALQTLFCCNLRFMTASLSSPLLVSHFFSFSSLLSSLSLPLLSYLLLPFPPHSPDATRIFVLVGLGFHAEMTLPEALQFIEQKEKHLSK